MLLQPTSARPSIVSDLLPSLTRRFPPLLAVMLSLLILIPAAALGDGQEWVHPSEAGHRSSEAENQPPGNCEGVLGIPFGTDPQWVRVGGSTSPSTPFIEAR